jgi:hypothetical protein
MNFENKLWKILELKNNEPLKELIRLIYLYNYMKYVECKVIKSNFIINWNFVLTIIKNNKLLKNELIEIILLNEKYSKIIEIFKLLSCYKFETFDIYYKDSSPQKKNNDNNNLIKYEKICKLSYNNKFINIKFINYNYINTINIDKKQIFNIYYIFPIGLCSLSKIYYKNLYKIFKNEIKNIKYNNYSSYMINLKEIYPKCPIFSINDGIGFKKFIKLINLNYIINYDNVALKFKISSKYIFYLILSKYLNLNKKHICNDILFYISNYTNWIIINDNNDNNNEIKIKLLFKNIFKIKLICDNSFYKLYNNIKQEYYNILEKQNSTTFILYNKNSLNIEDMSNINIKKYNNCDYNYKYNYIYYNYNRKYNNFSYNKNENKINKNNKNENKEREINNNEENEINKEDESCEIIEDESSETSENSNVNEYHDNDSESDDDLISDSDNDLISESEIFNLFNN